MLLRLGSEWVSVVMHVRHSAPAVSTWPRLAIEGLFSGAWRSRPRVRLGRHWKRDTVRRQPR
ncbi:hypothetical protein CGRA01v4_03192 [Colletotrichum graminicola]|nr:hypothetical protein CGRA01v4_03192 [Colletotrichum graminicola]